MTYQPAEDTFLLLEILEKHIDSTNVSKKSKKCLKICEVGLGSGEILINLSKKFSNNNFFGTDINLDAIQDSKQLSQKENQNEIQIKQGSFLTPFTNEKFDIIYFNTPYLPVEDGEKFEDLTDEDKALYGGTLGCEVTNEFIDSLHSHIHNYSEIFILISSLTQPHLVEESIKENGFDFEIVGREKHFFEELLVYKLTPSSTLQYLITNKYENISKFNKGKHSYILQATLPNTSQKVMIKTGKEQHISKEIFYLQKLQETTYSPKIIEYKSNFVIYHKINGTIIEDFLIKSKTQTYTLEQIEQVLNNIFKICFDLDLKGISKDEMTRPHHHIFISEQNLDEIYFIDFERSTLKNRFENSRQFMQYVVKYGSIFEQFNKQLSREKVIQIGKEIITKQKPITIQQMYT